jgi:hypothetical protein
MLPLTEGYTLENDDMATDMKSTDDSEEILADLQAAALYAASGVRDAEVMRQASVRMDRMRKELRQKHGEMNVAVDLVREICDEE